MDLLRPKALVELGTHYGVSYCAFCQAVKELGLDTRCYAVDTWQGDDQAGFYGPEVLSDLEEHHNFAYGSFSRLIQSTFEEALQYFPDGTFDLLHIDGYHTYDAVKGDFEKWLPKLTKRGIVLFHDINVRERGFGVWRFWDEIKAKYPSFEFVHSHGLGVLGVGTDYSEELNALLHCSESEALSVRRFFSSLGARLSSVQELQNLKPELHSVNYQLGKLSEKLEGAAQQISALTGQVQERDALLTQKGTELTTFNTRLLEVTRQREELDALLGQKGAELTTYNTRLLEVTRQHEELERRTTAQDELIRDKELQLKSAIERAEAAEHNLKEQAERVIALEVEAERVKALEVEAERVTALELELKTKNIAAEVAQRELQSQAQLIRKLEQDLEQQVSQQIASEAAIESKNVSDEELNHKLQEQENQISELEQELADRNAKLQSATMQIRNWERRAQEVAHLVAGMEEIRHTGSYKLVRALSSPLRWKYRQTLRRLINRANHPQNHNRPALPPQQPAYSAKDEKLTNHENGDQGVAQPALPEPPREVVYDSDWCLREHLWIFTNVVTRETALFDGEWYRRENPDVARSKVDPLVHYLRWGANEGRAPHPLFDPKFYLTTNPEAAMNGGANALKHYLTEGWTKGFKPHPKFDPAFYLMTYPDIAQAGVEPLTHFITNGVREGRNTCLEDLHLEPFETDLVIPREPNPGGAPAESDVRAIAFYLPQFHPIPENDKWWGTGFTEWTNVRRGEPQFIDHYQPHVPSDLGYYDLREAEVLERQVAMAREYGIYGFCFYYYWFDGKILLDLPIRRMLETGKPDFPFCICWANENWTRRWDGQDSEILIGQKHSPADDLAFLENIEPILLHKNYIRVDGKPMLIVYQPSILPNAKETADRWRTAFRKKGHGELYLVATQTFANRTPPQEFGFDAVIQFPPHASCAPITSLAKGLNKSYAGHVYDYNQTKWSFIDELYQLSSSRRIYPGVMPSWDNTARRRNKANIWINSSPESYYDWLWQVSSFLRTSRPESDQFVFINAWNEWAEGCHLEPDQDFGYAWLNATKLALQPQGA